MEKKKCAAVCCRWKGGYLVKVSMGGDNVRASTKAL
jgi:hypothetical protein